MSLGGGGREIPKRGRAGRARSQGIWPRGGGEIPRDLAPGGEITGGRNPWDTGLNELLRRKTLVHKFMVCFGNNIHPFLTNKNCFKSGLRYIFESHRVNEFFNAIVCFIPTSTFNETL